MRIGIYTQPLRLNYGGLLQAWALQTVLRRMGHEVVTFNLCPYLYLSRKEKPYNYAKRIINKCLGRINTIYLEEEHNKKYDEKIVNIQPFINKYLKLKKFKSIKDINVAEYDTIIVGSDQVWRPMYNTGYGLTIETSFLDFAKNDNIKRIAYGASFGTTEWELTDGQTTKCAELAKLFSAVSVREGSGVDLCERYLGIEATQVLDPTMLLSKDDYEKIIDNSNNHEQPPGDLLYFILDKTDEKRIFVNKIAKEKGMQAFCGMSNFCNNKTKIDQDVQPSVEQWLRNFRDSSFVITDSFHGCVFSIIFHKPFVAIINNHRGAARFISLANMFDLHNHLLFNIKDYDSSDTYTISSETYKKWAILKKNSLDFIYNSLSN